MRIAIFDYGAGNLHSLAKALDASLGVTPQLEAHPGRATDCDLLVLPGVGNFGSAAARLAPGLARMHAAIAAGLPTLGICLGMQLLFDRSDEGPGEGLGVLAGRVRRLRAQRVPHMGWNRDFYFAHSFVCEPRDESIVRAWAVHEDERFPSVVLSGSVVGVQFHPEKSGAAGLSFLRSVLPS